MQSRIRTMKIAVVGAGFAGLSTAKVLREFGHEVVVFDKAPDVGGVWGVTRRYRGVRTQNDKGTYALSDLPIRSAGSQSRTEGRTPSWPTAPPSRPIWWCAVRASGSGCRSSTRRS
jgi:cation diffusion facilitator CzcD-associated flavoprotein CzcO